MRMKSVIAWIAVFSACWTGAVAADWDVSAGVGVHVYIVDYEAAQLDDDFGGNAFVLTAAFNDLVAVRGLIHGMEHEDYRVEMPGRMAEVLVGRHLASEGFRFYGLVGRYAETWKYDGHKRDMGGSYFGGGIGYTWSRIVLDYWMTGRDSDDYARLMSEFGITETFTAASGGLSLSYRF